MKAVMMLADCCFNFSFSTSCAFWIIYTGHVFIIKKMYLSILKQNMEYKEKNVDVWGEK